MCVLLYPQLASHVHISVDASNTGSKKLQIFCYTGQHKSWINLWVNPRITIEGSGRNVPDDLSIFYGRNVSEVKNKSSSPSLFGLNSWLLLKEEHSFSPFNFSCIGLTSAKYYSVSFRIRNPELWYTAYIISGIVIFLFAPSWSRNVALHYTTGMTVGVLASVLLIMFILTRLMPQRLKTVSYVVMAVSSSASLFMFQLVKTYLQDIIRDHWQIALGYVLVSALISFTLIYRFGPVQDGRTLNLVCWVMQGLGLVLVYQGTQIPEASAAIILLLITFYFCPKSVPQWIRTLRFRWFPPRHRFLTEEEYLAQGEVETKKALDELRQYCCSPDCNAWRVVGCLKSPSHPDYNPWKVVSRLKSPSQFAKFVDGDVHVSDSEMVEHEEFIQTPRRLFHNLSNNRNDDDDSEEEEDSDGEFSLRRERTSHHNSNGYVDSDVESEIEDTAYERANRFRR
ncbi:hypothetical protein ACOMHN_037814 [Nucella lapillus]